jgi:hypothetical protein
VGENAVKKSVVQKKGENNFINPYYSIIISYKKI